MALFAGKSIPQRRKLQEPDCTFAIITTEMNSLHDETLTWIGDGSDGSTLNQSGNDLEIGSKSAGTPFNLRLDSEKVTSDYYVDLEIKQLQGHLSVGAVRKDEFKAGWKTKGLFYNVRLNSMLWLSENEAGFTDTFPIR